MLKGLGVLLGGVFIGAVGVEIVRKKCPDAREKVCTKVREVASDMKAAFMNGYQRATRNQESAEVRS